MSGSGYPKGGHVPRAVMARDEERKLVAQRAVHAREAERAARALAGALPPSEIERDATCAEFAGPSMDGVAALLQMLVDLTGRRIGRTTHLGNDVLIQRCRACRAEIETQFTEIVKQRPDWAARIGERVRLDYAAHQCAPVDVALTKLAPADLDALYESTERDIDRVSARAALIQAEIRRRSEA